MLLGTQDKDFFPEDITEKFRFVKEMGFDCFEIDGKVLTENLAEVKKAVQVTGLSVCTACGGYRGWIGDFIEEKRLNGIEDLKKILRAVSEGTIKFFVPILRYTGTSQDPLCFLGYPSVFQPK